MSKPTERVFKVIIPQIHKVVLEDMIRKMSKRFGGVSIDEIQGAWVNPKTGRIIYDRNYELSSARDLNGTPKKILVKDRKFLNEMAKEIGRRTKQQQIYTEEDIIKDVTFVKIPELKEVI